jgi:hypothetical protein
MRTQAGVSQVLLIEQGRISMNKQHAVAVGFVPNASRPPRAWEQEMRGGAVILGAYRYVLWREWASDLPRLLFVLLNPSTADGSTDDPTLRRCIGFARDWEYGSIELVNLFAYRSVDPGTLRRVADPVGPLNDSYILQAASRAGQVVVAWGALGGLCGRAQEVTQLLTRPLSCLGYTAEGMPRHPLYLRRDVRPLPYPAIER